MKLLFLDVDGVVWTVGGTILARQLAGKERANRHELDPVALAIVGDLVQEFDFKVVVSSTWRLGNTVEELKEILGPIVGAAIIGVTPAYRDTDRGVEIKAFLDNWNEFYRGGPVDDFIILDDDRDMNPVMGHLFWTDSYDGIGIRDRDAIARYLKMGPWEKKWTKVKKIVWYNFARKCRGIWWRVEWKVRDIKNLLIKKEVDKPLPPA